MKSSESERAETHRPWVSSRVEGGGDAVTARDLAGRIVSWDEGAERLYGYSSAEASRLGIEALVPEDAQAFEHDLVEAVVRGEDVAPVEIGRVAKDGRRLRVWLTITPLLDERRRVVGVVAVERDITERAQVVDLLRDSALAERRTSRLLRTIADSIPDPLFVKDDRGRMLFMSRAALQVVGKPAEKVLGRTNLEAFDDTETGAALADSDWRTLEAGGAVASEQRIETSTGVRWFLSTKAPTHDAAGRITGLVGVARDITERKRTEEALRENEERFRLLVQGVRDCAIYGLAPDGTVSSWNAGAEQIFGYRAEEVVGRYRAFFFTEEEQRAGEPQRSLEEAAATGRCEQDGWRIRKDGSRFWANVLLTALRDEAGNLRGFANVTRDFTERKRAETERERLARQRQLALDAARLGWWHYDPVTRRSSYDDRYAEIFGVSGDERPNDEILKLLHPDDLPAVWAAVEAALAPDDPRQYSTQFRITRPDGVSRWIEAHGIATFEGEGPARHATSLVGTVEDVTERRHAEDALRASEQRLRLAQEAARIGAFEWDVQSGLNTWTPELEDMYGLARGTFGGTEAAWEQLVHPEDRAEALRRVEQAFETGAPTEGEWRVVWPDGSIHWVASRWQVLKDASGKPARMTGVNMDVTERKRAEELRETRERELATERAVRESSETWAAHLARLNERLTMFAVAAEEARAREASARADAERREQELQALFGAMRDGVLVYGADGRIRATNAAATEFFEADLRGLTMAELIQRFALQSLEDGAPPGAPVPEERLPGRRASRGEVIYGERMRLRTSAGLRTLLVSASPLYRDGAGDGALVVFRDVTLYERAVEAARRAAEQIRLSHDAIFVWQFRDGIESWNRGAEDLYGFGRDEARGRSPGELLQTRYPRPWPDLERDLRQRRRWEGELVQITRDGREVVVSAKLQLLRHDDGVERVLEVGRDITDRKRAEQALRESEQQLREADRRKDEFLAMLSHELRNPLAPIRNSLYVLDRAAPGGEQARRAKDVIERQVHQLTRLVSDLLDVSRITRGKVQLQRERLDLRDVVQRTLEDQRAMFAANGLELRAERSDQPLWVDGDPARLAQVLTNLLHNASKFTKEPGTVTVSVRQEEAAAVLQIRDTGAGIAPDLLARIFDPFTQGEQSLARAAGGLGLGLALVKGIVELHGGTVAAHSGGVGAGAVFTVRIPPAGRPAPAARPAPKLMKPHARRVLVIEDNVDAADTLREVLEFQDHEVAVAFSGPEGLEKARSFQPDLILCDIGLPGLDGYGVARALRSDERLREVPLVAMTGYALAEDRQRAAEAGFDRHLAKPADVAALERVLAELPVRGDAPAAEGAPGP